MEGLLTEHCQYYFLDQDIRRGQNLLDAGGVLSLNVGSDGAIATVRGSQRNAYHVFLTFEELYPEQLLGVSCECARAEAGHLCKHVWAVIANCEQAGVLTEPLEDLEICTCDPAVVKIGVPLHQNASKRRSGTTNGMKPWRQKLLSVSTLANGVNIDVSVPLYDQVETQTQLWFVVSLDKQVDGGPLLVKLYRSTRKKDGDWGKLTGAMVRLHEINHWSNPKEQAAMRLLNSGTSQNYYGQRSYYDSTGEFRIDPDVAAISLRALSETGRFAWSLLADRSVPDLHSLTFAGEERFHLFVRIAPEVGEDGKTRLRVEPTLRRQDQRIAIADVVAVAEGGIFLMSDCAGLLPAHQVPFVRSWQQIGSIEVPMRSLATVLDEAMNWRGIELELAPELEIRQFTITPKPRLHLSSPDQALRGDLHANVLMVYRDDVVDITDAAPSFWDRTTKTLCHRNRAAESQWLESLPSEAFRYKSAPDDGASADSATGLRLRRSQLPKMVTDLTRAGWEVIADGNVMRRPGNFNVAVESGQDWFDLNASADFDGVLASLPELLAALRRGQDFILLDDGSHGMLPTEWLKQFHGYDKTGLIEGDSIRFTKTQALLLDALLSQHENVSLDKAFKAWCEKLNSFAGISPADATEGFNGQLRDYQRLGLGWFGFLQEFRLGGCLADDMGLGKTIQVLAMLEQRRAETPNDEPRRKALIVVPKSLIFNWMEEGKRFAPGLRMLNYTGTTREESQASFDNYDAIVTTYGTMRNDIEFLRHQAFDYVILDEAQAIKNPASLAAKSSRLLSAEHRLAMTGTPVENHLGDLWSLFDFLNPGMLGQAISMTGIGTDAATAEDDERLQQVSQSLRPFILRRTKAQVLTELPEKTEQTLYCEMSTRQRKLYEELRSHYRSMLMKKIRQDGLAKSKIVVLEALLRLRQAACDPRLVDPKSKVHGAKIGRLVEQVEEMIGEGHKALVFSQFTSLLSLVRQELDKRGVTYEYLDGKTTKRQQHVERFQSDPDCPLFLISLKAGGHGLNLTAADYVFIMDPWWNPAVEAQAIDRAHRMGQTRSVVAYRMICRDTVEEKIVDLQTSKRKLADAIISQEKSLVGDLTSDDLRMLFS